MNFSNRPVTLGALRTTPLVLTLLCPLASGAEIFWANPVTGSFSDSSLWTGGVVPGASDGATINAGTVNVDADWTLTSATAGTLAAGNALFNQTAGNVALTGDLRLGTVAAATGAYTLAGGKLTVTNSIRAGEMGSGTLKIAADLDQTTVAQRVIVGNRSLSADGAGAAEESSAFASPSSTGSIQHTAGAFTSAGEIWVGLGSGGTGTADAEGGHSDLNFGMYELSGTAALTAKNWLTVGRTGGEGVFNMSGGTLTKTTDNGSSMMVGALDGGRTSSHGTFNQTAGAVVSAAPLNIGNGSTTGAVLRGYGTYNLGGASSAVTISNTLSVGRQGGSGILNVTGGTLTRNNAGNSYLGDGTPSEGTLNQTGGAVNIAFGEFRIGNGIDATNTIQAKGTYNLNGGTLTVSGTNSVGRAGGKGAINVTSGTLIHNTGGNTIVGDGAYSVGAITQSSGLVDLQNGELWVGNGQIATGGVRTANASGAYTLSGDGVLNVNNWLAIGRDGGQGVFTMNGGTVNKAGAGNVTIGAIGTPGAVGTVNQSAGTFNNTTSATYLGEGNGQATWNLSGTGSANLGLLSIGQSGAAQGTFNLDGGTLTATQIGTGSSSQSFFNFNGGTLKASAADPVDGKFFKFISDCHIKSGGALIDTNGFDVSIDASIQSGVTTGLDGGLTKNGAGTLHLTGFGNTFTGPTIVNAGSLELDNVNLDNSSNLTVRKDAGLKVSSFAMVNSNITLPGILSFAGSSVGQLSINGNLTLSSLSSVNFRIDGASSTSDNVTITKSVAIGSAALSIASIDGSALPLGKVYTLMSCTGTLTGTFANAANNATVKIGNSSFKIVYTTKGVTATVISSTSQTVFDQWVATTALTAANNGRSADPDNDGLPNYAEFALASSPTVSGNGGNVSTSILQLDATTRALAITLPVRTGVTFSGTGNLVSTATDGITYTIQGSTNLVDFTTTAVTEVTPAVSTGMPVLPDGWTYRTFRAPGTPAATPREFLRVKIDDTK